MNNYILNSGNFTYNNKTYNYVETNNHYNFPYVFKTDSSSDPIIYVKQMSPYGSGAGVSGSFSPDGTNQFGPLIVYYTIKAYGVATIKEAAEIGETTSDSNLLIIKNSLDDYNCKLKDTTIIEYTDNRCVNYDDIDKINVEPNIFVYHIYLNHNGGFMSENSNNLIYYKNVQESGWEDNEKPQNYNDSIRTDITLSITGTHTGEFGSIDKPLSPSDEERWYTYKVFSNLNYTFTLSNNNLTYNWNYTTNKDTSQISGTTDEITTFVEIITPPSGESFDGDPQFSSTININEELIFNNATINGKTIKLYLTII